MNSRPSTIFRCQVVSVSLPTDILGLALAGVPTTGKDVRQKRNIGAQRGKFGSGDRRF